MPKRIRAGASREDALRAFKETVNQPSAMFSTNHWLQPKLELLSQLLHDPITHDESVALLDVLYQRHWMRDLLDWLRGTPMSWPNFFVHCEFLKEEAERDRREKLRKADEKWERALAPVRANVIATELASAQQEYLSRANPCPGCGTPPEHLEWFHYSSPRSSWANLCGRAGWKTRCKFCLKEVDFFVGMMN